MTTGLGKCSKIRHIVRLRRVLRRWTNKARMSSTRRIPSDVPAGHVAVCVGSSYTRFVVCASYLNHPVFGKLLSQAEEEYGFSNHGPLAIPCDVSLFQEVICYISKSESGNQTTRYCHVGSVVISKKLDFWTESRPLLCSKTIW